jgi:hypothetical protein
MMTWVIWNITQIYSHEEDILAAPIQTVSAVNSKHSKMDHSEQFVHNHPCNFLYTLLLWNLIDPSSVVHKRPPLLPVRF